MIYSSIYDDTIKKYLESNLLVDSSFSQTYALFKSSVHWTWFKAQMFTESALIEKDGTLFPNPKSENKATHASGLFQIMPSNFEYCQITDPFDPEQSIRAGIYLDFREYAIFRSEIGWDRIRFMLGAYNAGQKWIIEAQSKASENNLNPYRWESITKMLPLVTGEDNSKQTIEYVSKIENLSNILVSTI